PMPVPIGDPTAATQLAPVESETTAAPMLAPVTEPQPERKRRWPWFTIGLLTLALAGMLIFLGVSALTAKETKEVPRVTGTQLIEAREILERAGFEVDETRVQSRTPLDRVLDQDPDADEEAEEGSTVVLEVSGGPGTVRVPSLAGLPVKQAIDELRDRDLVPNLERRPSETVKEGLVIRSVPKAGDVVERNQSVTVFISSGPEAVAVPDVTGLSRETAEGRISDAGLTPNVEEQESEEPEGEVISQDPTGGTEVDRGATVTITISTGVERVNVPNVLGLEAADAASQLAADGLVPVERQSEVTDPEQDGKVIDQRPSAGTEVDKGREVVIIIGELVEQDTIAPGQQPEATP
ncbi:MAG: PASTA domain-containing protein, partial [Actinomycetota bacterium]|nr:PASTA domain-containing protein [Actinomycetota bacterium]